MKKSLLLPILLLYGTAAFSQPAKEPPQHFVIQGKAIHPGSAFWEFAITGFFDNKIVSIPYAEDGTFTKTVSITHPQNLYLYLNNDAITIFAVPGDTLTINWDSADFSNTFDVTSSHSGRQQELNLMLKLYKAFRQPFLQLSREMYSRDIADSTKYRKVKEQFSGRVGMIASEPMTVYTRKILCDTYFNYTQLLLSGGVFPRYQLSLDGVWPDSLQLFGNILHTQLNEFDFYISQPYREFLFEQTSRSPFNSYISKGSGGVGNYYTLQDCYRAMGVLKIPVIRDWFLAKAIIRGFGFYDFAETEEAYKKMLPEIKTEAFRDTLQKFYSSIRSLKPGNPAPDFTLKTPEGEEVTLSDFRGKVVYIEFWGVYCGPCRYDLKNSIPKLHEKYKDEDLVFLNICVDVDEPGWKKGIEELQVEGVNLLAEGWTKNPVCQDYNVSAIPHYVLIDREGNIANNTGPRPSRLIAAGENELDRLLAQ